MALRMAMMFYRPVMMIAAIGVGAVGLGFLVAGLFTELETFESPTFAAFLTASGLILIAGLMVAVAIRGKHGGKPEMHPIQRQALLEANLLCEDFLTFARNHAGITLACSLLTGIAFGAIPELRRALKELAVAAAKTDA